jgi:hypothetical protein
MDLRHLPVYDGTNGEVVALQRQSSVILTFHSTSSPLIHESLVI